MQCVAIDDPCIKISFQEFIILSRVLIIIDAVLVHFASYFDEVRSLLFNLISNKNDIEIYKHWVF